MRFATRMAGDGQWAVRRRVRDESFRSVIADRPMIAVRVRPGVPGRLAWMLICLIIVLRADVGDVEKCFT